MRYNTKAIFKVIGEEVGHETLLNLILDNPTVLEAVDEEVLSIVEDETDIARDEGFEEGKQYGLTQGYDDGWNDGYDEGHDDGYKDGENEGYDTAFEHGQEDGYQMCKEEFGLDDEEDDEEDDEDEDDEEDDV